MAAGRAAMAADTRASGVAVPHRALFLLAHPPHCRSQPCGLVVLMIGFLLLNQFRADIIAARVQSLTTQAKIISAAIAASAAIDTDTITIDPDKLLQLAPGQ